LIIIVEINHDGRAQNHFPFCDSQVGGVEGNSKSIRDGEHLLEKTRAIFVTICSLSFNYWKTCRRLVVLGLQAAGAILLGEYLRAQESSAASVIYLPLKIPLWLLKIHPMYFFNTGTACNISLPKCHGAKRTPYATAENRKAVTH
jgi:hypothetical protein